MAHKAILAKLVNEILSMGEYNLDKQPNKNLPNNQIVIKFFCLFHRKVVLLHKNIFVWQSILIIVRELLIVYWLKN